MHLPGGGRQALQICDAEVNSYNMPLFVLECYSGVGKKAPQTPHQLFLSAVDSQPRAFLRQAQQTLVVCMLKSNALGWVRCSDRQYCACAGSSSSAASSRGTAATDGPSGSIRRSHGPCGPAAAASQRVPASPNGASAWQSCSAGIIKSIKSRPAC
jgi:hypothetical protein